MDLEKIYGKIGTEEELIEKIHLFYEKDKENVLIVRAIRQRELQQLIQDGPDKFLFHNGCNYLCDYGTHVRLYSELRSGTIVVASISKKEILDHFPNEGEDIQDKKIAISSMQQCITDFIIPVEVYNTKGLSWKKLIKYSKNNQHL